MAEPRPDFQQLQYRFAAHLRDPARQPAPPGIEDRRLRIYRELFFNNIEDFLANAFPVLRQLHGEPAWLALVRDFYARHQCRDPQLNGVAAEFLRYLDEERGEVEGDPPFLRELAHYEWVELALSVAEDAPAPAETGTDLLDGVPCLSPLAWPLVYTWPVHRIGPDFQPREPDATPTCLVVYRAPDESVRFLEINPLTARLLELAGERPDASGRALIAAVAGELGVDATTLLAPGAGMLESLRARGILTGARRLP